MENKVRRSSVGVREALDLGRALGLPLSNAQFVGNEPEAAVAINTFYFIKNEH